MKLVELNCPSCGAQMQVNVELKSCTCNFCGKQMIIDDEIRRVEVDQSEAFGYGFEKGRMDALRGEADKGTVELISRIKKYFEDKKELDRDLTYKYTERKKLRTERNQKNLGDFSIPASIVGIIGFLSLLVLLCDISIVWKVLIVIGVVALCVLILGYFKAFYDKKEAVRIENIDRQLADLEVEIKSTKDKLEQLKTEGKNLNLDIIPNEYRNSEALTYIRSSLASGKALTLHQAFALYDDEKRHRDMMEYQMRQMDLQRKEIEALRRQQIETVNSINARNESDSGVGKQVAQAALAVGATVVAGKVVKKILKGL